MPTYEYRCKNGHTFELFHSIKDESVKRCPKCGARARRVPAGGAGLLFKGSGFYITDYRSRSYQEKAKQEKAPPPAASSGSEGGSSATPAKPKDPGNAKSGGAGDGAKKRRSRR